MPRWAKVILGVVGVLVLLIVVAAAALYGVSQHLIDRQYAVASHGLVHTTDSATIARGRHLVVAVGQCAECHNEDFGGKVIVNDPVLGRLASANLTPGQGGIAQLSDADIVRAVRQGLKPNGTSLAFMPSSDYSRFSNADMVAILSYLRSLPPVNRPWEPSQFGPMGRVLLVTKTIPEFLPARYLRHDGADVPEVASGPTAVYGEYLAHVAGCTGCHTPSLHGGPIPGGDPSMPPAANISRDGLHGWSEDDFLHALHTGQRPDNTVISSAMPWRFSGQMTDDELRAIWRYIQSLPSTPDATGPATASTTS